MLPTTCRSAVTCSIPDTILIPLVERTKDYMRCRSHEFGITKECIRASGQWHVEFTVDSHPDKHFESWAECRDFIRSLQCPQN